MVKSRVPELLLRFSGGVPQSVQDDVRADVEKLLREHGRGSREAHLALHVKSPEKKHLFEAHANLVTDKGRYNSENEGWSVDDVCNHCMDDLRVQMERQAI